MYFSAIGSHSYAQFILALDFPEFREVTVLVGVVGLLDGHVTGVNVDLGVGGLQHRGRVASRAIAGNQHLGAELTGRVVEHTEAEQALEERDTKELVVKKEDVDLTNYLTLMRIQEGARGENSIYG